MNTRNKIHQKIGKQAYLRYVVLSVLLMLPNFLLLFVARDIGFAWWVLLQSIVFWLLMSLMVSNIRILVLLSIPFLIVLPIECYFIYTYGYPSTKFVLTSLFETSLQETKELLSGLWWILFIFALIILGFITWLLKGAKSVSIVDRRVQVISFVVALSALAVWQYARFQPGASLAIRQYNFASSFPIGIAYKLLSSGKLYIEGQKNRKLIERHQFSSKSSLSDMTVVLVIGESARPDHWGLNGYSRNTTPNLASRADIHFLPDLVTPWTLTTYSTPLLIKRKPATYKGIFPEKSLFTAFKSAGFSTYWFANQDGLTEMMLHIGEAEQRKNFNFSVEGGDALAAFDGEMLPEVDTAIRNTSAKKLIIVHSKGSHWDYHLRYPPKFSAFKPDYTENISGKHDPSQREALVNGYDNSISYTDYFLNEIIKKLEKLEKPAALVYVSDHGEGLYDNGCNIYGHGNDTEINYRTAGLVWISKELRANRLEVVEALEKNSKMPLTTELTIFNTLADLGQLNIADAKHSLLSKSFDSQQRLVNTSSGFIDFDSSTRIGACKLVVER